MTKRISIQELDSRQEFEDWLAGLDDRLSALAERTGLDLDYTVESLAPLGQWAAAIFASHDELMAEAQQTTLNQLASYEGEVYRRNVPGITWGIDIDPAEPAEKRWPRLEFPDGSWQHIMNSPTYRLRTLNRPKDAWGHDFHEVFEQLREQFATTDDRRDAPAGQPTPIDEQQYRALIFCPSALTVDVAVAAIRQGPWAVTFTGQDHFQIEVDGWLLDATRSAVTQDEEASDVFSQLNTDPSLATDGELDIDTAYTKFWTVAGSADPNMDWFNDWLIVTEQVAGAHQNAVWIDVGPA